MAEETDTDVFDDQPASQGAAQVSEAEIIQQPENTESADNNKDDQTGDEENPSGTPPEGTEEKSSSSTEKMIPESRFKAALKDVTSKLDAANQELATFKAVPVPDKDKDPEGYEFHNRMELSREIMREAVTDYDDVIANFAKMAEANPYLNEAVAKHRNPAKFAYDYVKKAMEIEELSTLKDTEEWKEFQEFKKSKGSASASKGNSKVSGTVAESLASKVPNLNRATNVSQAKPQSSADDELFAGAL